jgi:hypothetical protein
MGLTRALGRAATLALAGAAAGYLLRRRGLLGAQPAGLAPPPAPPSEPMFVTQPDEPEEGEFLAVEVEPAPAEEPDAETAEWSAAEVEEAAGEVIPPPPGDEERPDVTAVVDDLLGQREGSVVDAEVVPAPDDTRVAEAVRMALAEEPGLLSAPIDIEVEGGYVTLRGELDRAEGIAAVERAAERVEGVRGVKSYLQTAAEEG